MNVFNSLRKLARNVAERHRSAAEGRTTTVYTISIDEPIITIDSTTVENQNDSRSFDINDVTVAVAFKRDLMFVDNVCLSFELPTGWVEVDEEMQGFGTLLESLESLLPGFPPSVEWWHGVCIPAFKTNYTVLWTRGIGVADLISEQKVKAIQSEAPVLIDVAKRYCTLQQNKWQIEFDQYNVDKSYFNHVGRYTFIKPRLHVLQAMFDELSKIDTTELASLDDVKNAAIAVCRSATRVELTSPLTSVEEAAILEERRKLEFVISTIVQDELGMFEPLN